MVPIDIFISILGIAVFAKLEGARVLVGRVVAGDGRWLVEVGEVGV